MNISVSWIGIFLLLTVDEIFSFKFETEVNAFSWEIYSPLDTVPKPVLYQSDVASEVLAKFMSWLSTTPQRRMQMWS
jgi:hypothetical protein